MEVDYKEETKPTEDIKEQPDKKDKSDVKLEKLQHQIEEKKLESERRKAVVETKTIGAEIEIKTILREEIKRRTDNTQQIPEITKRLDKIEGMLSKLTVNRATPEFQEDVMYNELMSSTEKSPFTDRVNARKESKKCYFNIKIMKKEIFELEKQIDESIAIPDIRELEKIRNPKQDELGKNLKKLAELWSEFS